MPTLDAIAAFQAIFDSADSIAQKLHQAATLLASTPIHITTLERYMREASFHTDYLKHKEPAEVATPFHRFLAYVLVAQKHPTELEKSLIEIACKDYFLKRYTFLGTLSLDGAFTKKTFFSDDAVFIKESANQIALVKAFWPTTPEALAAFSVKVEKPESTQACFAHFKEKAENGVITDKMSLDDCANLLFAKTIVTKFETEVLPKLGDDKAVNEALIRQFLKERTDTNQKTGYTGSPDSLANQFCVGLALSCIDKAFTDLDFNQTLWQMLMPNIIGAHNLEDHEAWPPYGTALLDNDLLRGKEGKIWSYPFLLGTSQTTGIFAHWQNKPLPADCQNEAENIKSLFSLLPFQDKPSPETWQRVFTFRPEHRDFWATQQATLSEKKPIENLFDFFTDVNAVLDKFKRNENDPASIGTDISAEGHKAITPLLETWHAFLKQASGIAFVAMANGKETPLQKNIKTLVTVMNHLIQPGNVQHHSHSCFDSNHRTLNPVLKGKDTAALENMLRDFQISKTFRPAPELSKIQLGGRDNLPYNAALYSRMAQSGQSRAVLRKNLLDEIVSAPPAATTLPGLIRAGQEWVQTAKIEARDKALFNFIFEINNPEKRTQFLKPFLEHNLPFDNTLENYLLTIKMLQCLDVHPHIQMLTDALIKQLPQLSLSVAGYRLLSSTIDSAQKEAVMAALGAVAPVLEALARGEYIAFAMWSIPSEKRGDVLARFDNQALMALVKSAYDFKCIAEILPETQYDVFIASFDDQALMALVKSGYDFKCIAEILPETQRDVFIASFDNETLMALVKSPYDFKCIAEILPETQRDVFIASFDNETLMALVKSPYDFKCIAEILPETQRDVFIASVDNETLMALVKSPYDFKCIAEILPETQRDVFIASFDNETLMALAKDIYDFKEIAKVLPEARLAAFDNKALKVFVKNIDNFTYIAKALPKTQRDVFIVSFDDQALMALVENIAGFKEIAAVLPEARLAAFDNQALKVLVKNASAFELFAKGFSEARRAALCNETLRALVKSAYDFTSIAAVLPKTRRDAFTQSFDDQALMALVENVAGFKEIAAVLPEARLAAFDNQALKVLVKHAYAFELFAKGLSEARCAALCNETLRALVKSAYDFTSIAAVLPKTRRDAFTQSFDDQALMALVENVYGFKEIAAVLPEARLAAFDNQALKVLVKHASAFELFAKGFSEARRAALCNETLMALVKSASGFKCIAEVLPKTRRDAFIASFDYATLKTYHFKYVLTKMKVDLLHTMRTPVSTHVANRWRFGGMALTLSGAAFAAGYLLSNAGIIAITIGTLTGAVFTGGLFAAAALLIMLAVALALYHSQVFSKKSDPMPVGSVTPSLPKAPSNDPELVNAPVVTPGANAARLPNNATGDAPRTTAHRLGKANTPSLT